MIPKIHTTHQNTRRHTFSHITARIDTSVAFDYIKKKKKSMSTLQAGNNFFGTPILVHIDCNVTACVEYTHTHLCTLPK